MNYASKDSPILVGLLLVVFSVFVSEACDAGRYQDKDEKKNEESKISTVEIESGPIVVFKAIEGIFESTKMSEVKAKFDSWSDLEIESVIGEGAVVNAGQELLQFDKTSIEKAIKEAEFGLKESEFALKSAKLNQKEIQTTFEMDKALAERNWKNAQSDYQYYQSVQLPDRLDDLAYSEKSAGYFLEYSQDELDQLTQMYTEDELTEESEEIVLKRAKRSVESAERSKKRTMRRISRDKETNVPREKIQQEDSLKKSQLQYDRQMATLPISKEKAEIALAQAEFSHANKAKKLDELKGDFNNMALKSPTSGTVYYGRCVRGKWVGSSGAPKRRLEPEKKVAANSVVMTIVDVSQMMVRASLDQAAMGSLNAGMSGKAKIVATNAVVPATIKSVSRIPLDAGTYDCQILVDKLPADRSVMPGMKCKLSFLVYENKNAILAPSESVFSDDDGVTHYVFSVAGDNVRRIPVTVGHKNGKKIEILSGLKVGDKIAKTKP